MSTHSASVMFRGCAALVLAGLPVVVSVGGPGLVERPMAFSVYLDPLPLPVVPFCPDCSALPGTTGSKVAVKVPTVQTAPASQAPKSPAR